LAEFLPLNCTYLLERRKILTY